MGDMIRVVKDGKFPCDILLLKCSNVDGVLFVDTANLDGETNLKDKNEPMASLKYEEVIAMGGKLFCDKANHILDEWDGEIISTSLEKSVICDIKNLLLRETVLKNTEWCVGIAVNLGKETKIMMNAKKPKSKLSKMMWVMNKLLYSVFFF